MRATGCAFALVLAALLWLVIVAVALALGVAFGFLKASGLW